MEFRKEIDVMTDREQVWELLKDYKRIPEFWYGTRSIEKTGDTYKVQFAFPGKAIMKLEEDGNNFVLMEKYLKGPFTGTKTIRLEGSNPVKIQSIWNIKLSPMLRAFSGKLQGHFQQGTEDALLRIKNYLEP